MRSWELILMIEWIIFSSTCSLPSLWWNKRLWRHIKMWCQIITSYPFICLFVVVIVFFLCTLVVNVWYREWYMGARRYGNSLRVFNSIAYEWAQRTSEMSSWTREEKFHIYKQPCISLFILFITSILKSLVVPVVWLALIGAIYSP